MAFLMNLRVEILLLLFLTLYEPRVIPHALASRTSKSRITDVIIYMVACLGYDAENEEILSLISHHVEFIADTFLCLRIFCAIPPAKGKLILLRASAQSRHCHKKFCEILQPFS